MRYIHTILISLPDMESLGEHFRVLGYPPKLFFKRVMVFFSLRGPEMAYTGIFV